MRFRLALGGLLAVLCIAPAAAWAGRAQNPLSDAIPIASGEFFGKPANVSAYRSTFGLCIRESAAVERGSSAFCGETAPLPAGGKAIEIDGSGFSRGIKGHSVSEVSGKLRTDVASVRVYFHRSGKRRSITAISGQVSAEGAATLKTPQFGRFLGVVGGCIPEREFKAVALAADGTVLGSQRGFRVPGVCHSMITTSPPIPSSGSTTGTLAPTG